MKTPKITRDLIDYLASIHPLKPPQLTQTDREIWMEAGRQNLIAHLKTLYDKQTSRGEL